jgi:hypothetical protein
MQTRTIAELAQVVRSKQAGPYRLTLDIVFDDPAVYERVRRSGVISAERVAALYGVPLDQITAFTDFEAGRAFKITMKRRLTAGDPGDTDVYGACQSAPLLDIEVPWDEERA